MEKKHYSISVEIPRHKTDKLGVITEDISYRKRINNSGDNLHLTIQSKIWSKGTCFKRDLCDYLSLMEPIEIELNKFDHFYNEKGAVIFMTTKNKYQRRQLEDLYIGINETIGAENLMLQRNIFIPHVTLFCGVPHDQTREIEEELHWAVAPISIDISRVSLSEKLADNNWKRVSLIDLGGVNCHVDNYNLIVRKSRY